MRKFVLWGVLVLCLVIANWSIFVKERVLSDGQTMLLQLAPRDPRSLLQGDYMALRYALAAEIGVQLGEQASASGLAVVSLDDNEVVELVRLADRSESLSDGEYFLRYRKRGDGVRVASNAFFFEEGQGDLLSTARYGELRVSDAGDAVLIGLRDDDFNSLRGDTRTDTQ